MNERNGLGTAACISYATDRLACSSPQTRWIDNETSRALELTFSIRATESLLETRRLFTKS
jgi:hypothetical protein